MKLIPAITSKKGDSTKYRDVSKTRDVSAGKFADIGTCRTSIAASEHANSLQASKQVTKDDQVGQVHLFHLPSGLHLPKIYQEFE